MAATQQQRVDVAPRFIRAGKAPAYLGMCRRTFNEMVRPSVREFPIGKQGIAFDRLELDAWADSYVDRKPVEKQRSHRQVRPCSERQGVEKCREKASAAELRIPR